MRLFQLPTLSTQRIVVINMDLVKRIERPDSHTDHSLLTFIDGDRFYCHHPLEWWLKLDIQ